MRANTLQTLLVRVAPQLLRRSFCAMPHTPARLLARDAIQYNTKTGRPKQGTKATGTQGQSEKAEEGIGTRDASNRRCHTSAVTCGGA